MRDDSFSPSRAPATPHRAAARETGAVALSLQTARTNRAAQRLYESLGWKRDEEFVEYALPLDQ